MLNLTEIDIDAATAFCIAAGMKEMANIDDDLHEDEVALIDDFLAEIKSEFGSAPSDESINTALLDNSDKQSLFLQSLTYVALADGVIHENEIALLQKYITEFNSNVTPQDLIRNVGKDFLERYRGTPFFREQAEAVGENFGLTKEEIAEILD